MRHHAGTAPRCATRTAAARRPHRTRHDGIHKSDESKTHIANNYKSLSRIIGSRERATSHTRTPRRRADAREVPRVPGGGGRFPPAPAREAPFRRSGRPYSRIAIGAGAAASDAGPRPPAQRPPPVPRDAIVRSSMGSLVDRACSGYTKTKKLNEAGERSAPVRVGELPGASPRGAGSPGRSARRVGLGF